MAQPLGRMARMDCFEVSNEDFSNLRFIRLLVQTAIIFFGNFLRTNKVTWGFNEEMGSQFVSI